ncbi:MAG: DUF3179 domain-containing protein [Planctomicrobium sp.]|jgi:hypothetical protein|nr:DUF3179 domain-containing protein [Planctomicrobium sp.]
MDKHTISERFNYKFSITKRWLLLLVGAVAPLAIFGLVMFAAPSDNSSKAFEPTPRRVPQFDLSNTTVDEGEIRAGGPPKDGIPALTHPKMILGSKATSLEVDDRIIGVVVDNEPRAYPLAILNYHEIVNDTAANVPIAVTYCPLCDSVAVFDRRTPLGVREFGVSGLLYNSNVLMFDRGGLPESLWSQVKNEGISGPGAGKKLATIPCELTTWNAWKLQHPDTLVLSRDTGAVRDYTINPYEKYFSNQQLMFPVTSIDGNFPNKERVLGVWVGEEYRAYPESRFPLDQNQITDKIGDKTLTISFDRNSKSMRVVSADEGISWMYSFWFAWRAMHPETTIFGGTTIQSQ